VSHVSQACGVSLIFAGEDFGVRSQAGDLPNMPPAVAAKGSVKAFASGGHHALALLKDGKTLHTWGTAAAAASGVLAVPTADLAGKTILAIAAVGDCSIVSVKEAPGIIQWGSGCAIPSSTVPPKYGGALGVFNHIIASGASADDGSAHHSGPAATFAAQRASDAAWRVWGTAAGSWQATRAAERAKATKATIKNIMAFGEFLLVRWSDGGLEMWDPAYKPMRSELVGKDVVVIGAATCDASMALRSDGRVSAVNCLGSISTGMKCIDLRTTLHAALVPLLQVFAWGSPKAVKDLTAPKRVQAR
jgi:hypothetical protein